MSEKESGKAENMFRDLGKRIDELLADLHQAKEKAKVEFDDQIEELKRNKETLKQEYDGFKERNKQQLDDIEGSLERAGKELKHAFKSVFSMRVKKEEEQ